MNQAAREPAGPVCTVKLEHASGSAVGTGGGLHGEILFHGTPRQLLAEGKHLSQRGRRVFQKRGHLFLPERVDFQTVLHQPSFHLRHAGRVVQLRQFLHLFGQFLVGLFIHVDGVFHQSHVDQDAPVVDLLVDAVLVPHFVRHGIVGQPALDLHFRFHVAPVVHDELLPPVGGVRGKIPGALPVGLGRSAGTAEVADQVSARFQLLLLQPQHRAGAGERKRKTEIGRPDHRAAPGTGIEETGLFA